MNYRCMQTGDYEAVMTLWRSCEGLLLRDADSKPRIESYLERNPGLSFVAHAGDAIVGSIMAGHDGKRGYVQHLAVDPGARGQGIASRLLELCLDALKLQGIEKAHVHVLKNNPVGRDYWLQRGWTERTDTQLYSFIIGDNENA